MVGETTLNTLIVLIAGYFLNGLEPAPNVSHQCLTWWPLAMYLQEVTSVVVQEVSEVCAISAICNMQSTIFDVYKICNMHNICWQQTFSFSMGKLCLITLIIMSLLTQTIIAITCYYVIINTNHHRHHLLLCDDKHKLSSSSSWSLASHIMVNMVTQHIPTSHIPIRWESVIMMKGGNMTQSNSHHTHI